MKKNGNNISFTLAVIGIVLIAIQIINYFGVARVYTGLFPDNNSLLYPNYAIEKTNINIREILFAFQVGIDRFASGFVDLFIKDIWRTNSSIQIASAYVRESLGCSDGGSFGLFIYDFLVVLSYCTVGIIGVVLLVLARIFSPKDIKYNSD